MDDFLIKRPETLKVMKEVQETNNICELQGYITRNYPTLPAFKGAQWTTNNFHECLILLVWLQNFLFPMLAPTLEWSEDEGLLY